MRNIFISFRLCEMFFAVLFLCANLYAQETPSLVIENSVRAMGGQKEISKIRNIKAMADCIGPNGKYTTEIYSASNSRLIFKQTRENGNNFTGQTNGQIFWTEDYKNKDFSLADKKFAFVWRSHDFQRLAIRLSDYFREFAFAGEENFAGKNALKLRAMDELGNPAHIFFDKETKLLLGFIIQNPFSEKTETIQTVFNEWKEIGKIKLPSKVTARDKQGDFVLSFREISLNKIEEKIFTVPQKIVAMREILELHNQERVAHFNRDAKLLVSKFADGFFNIRNGKIQRATKEENVSRMQNYFDNSTFIEWDDITPPLIHVSDDATMAYVIVHKKVRLLAKDESGKEQEETEVFAWVATYRKINGVWKLTAVASTNTPEKD